MYIELNKVKKTYKMGDIIITATDKVSFGIEKGELAVVLGWCVIPFIIPDLIKIGLALALSKRLGKALKLNEN